MRVSVEGPFVLKRPTTRFGLEGAASNAGCGTGSSEILQASSPVQIQSPFAFLAILSGCRHLPCELHSTSSAPLDLLGEGRLKRFSGSVLSSIGTIDVLDSTCAVSPGLSSEFLWSGDVKSIESLCEALGRTESSNRLCKGEP